MATQAKTKTAQAEPVQVNFVPHADKLPERLTLTITVN